MTTFGNRLYELRKSHGLTMKQLASWADMHLSHISDIENERSYPSLVTCQRIARAFDISLSELFEGVEVEEIAK